MAPIPIFTQSPVNAAKADGVTPETAKLPNPHSTPKRPEATTTTAPPPTCALPYPAPQPGARPAGPIETPTPTATHITTVNARHTPVAATTGTASQGEASPPPPQPGAVPIPPSRTALPPPPKATESKGRDPGKAGPSWVESSPKAMPPQMAMEPPTTPHSQRGTSTVAGLTGPRPTSLSEIGTGAGPASNPQGYQQGLHQHLGFTPAGPSGYQQPLYSGRGHTDTTAKEGEDDGVWEAAKKWAQAAGGSIAAAEDEVWRRINKG